MEDKKIPNFNELKVLLIRNNNTYEDLATCTGSSKPTIVRKMTGKTAWSWVDMQKIRLHYKLTDEQFMDIFFKQEVTKV